MTDEAVGERARILRAGKDEYFERFGPSFLLDLLDERRGLIERVKEAEKWRTEAELERNDLAARLRAAEEELHGYKTAFSIAQARHRDAARVVDAARTQHYPKKGGPHGACPICETLRAYDEAVRE